MVDLRGFGSIQVIYFEIWIDLPSRHSYEKACPYLLFLNFLHEFPFLWLMISISSQILDAFAFETFFGKGLPLLASFEISCVSSLLMLNNFYFFVWQFWIL